MLDRRFGQIALTHRADIEDTAVRLAMALQQIGMLTRPGYFISNAPRSIQQVDRNWAAGRFETCGEALD